ncbi:MAG: hypothetical protein KatS3mg058_1601 [Roseiflexus sp.]|nr:MAG: hypothetical protein KatS3mg058_1601 [Roseiflexus sp.]
MFWCKDHTYAPPRPPGVQRRHEGFFVFTTKTQRHEGFCFHHEDTKARRFLFSPRRHKGTKVFLFLVSWCLGVLVVQELPRRREGFLFSPPRHKGTKVIFSVLVSCVFVVQEVFTTKTQRREGFCFHHEGTKTRRFFIFSVLVSSWCKSCQEDVKFFTTKTQRREGFCFHHEGTKTRRFFIFSVLVSSWCKRYLPPRHKGVKVFVFTTKARRHEGFLFLVSWCLSGARGIYHEGTKTRRFFIFSVLVS